MILYIPVFIIIIVMADDNLFGRAGEGRDFSENKFVWSKKDCYICE